VALFKTTRLAGVLPVLAAERMRRTSTVARIDALIRARYQPWVRAIERAIARGELPNAEPRLIADLLAGLLVHRVLLTGGSVDERTWETAMAIVVNGLRAGASRRTGRRTATCRVKIKQ